jgi:mannose-6-phosphate isomerase
MAGELYPLLLERHLDERVWGGNKLVSFLGLDEPHPDRIAESWQVYDTNKVVNGRLAGKTLAEVTEAYREALVGTLSVPRYGADFPLLAKFIDAQQDLSIQVHPDDAYAHRVEAETGFHGKNEAWYVLEAKPDATLYYHLDHPVSREEFRQAVEAETVTELLNELRVEAGDVVYVPAGTIHTINAGITLFEIQQKSDLTYRIFDYGRPRELHLEKALDVIAYQRPPPPEARPLSLTPGPGGTFDRTLLLATPHFAMERWRVEDSAGGHTQATSLEIMTAVAGEGRLRWYGGELDLKQGTSLVLPAALGAYELVALGMGDGLTVLRCTVPDLETDVVEPLRRLGYEREEIDGVVFGDAYDRARRHHLETLSGETDLGTEGRSSSKRDELHERS